MLTNTINLFEMNEIDAAIADIMDGNNDLFNNYQNYDVTNIDNFNGLKRMHVELEFISHDDDLVIKNMTIDRINDTDIITYYIDSLDDVI